MLICIVNSEDSDQTASEEAVWSESALLLYTPFCQARSEQIFRTIILQCIFFLTIYRSLFCIVVVNVLCFPLNLTNEFAFLYFLLIFLSTYYLPLKGSTALCKFVSGHPFAHRIRGQSKMYLTRDEGRSNLQKQCFRLSCFLPYWSTFVDSICVFYCRLSGVICLQRYIWGEKLRYFPIISHWK